MNFKSYLTTLKILHLALVFGQVIFAAVVFYLIYSGNVQGDASLNSVFLIVIPCLILVSISAGVFLFNTRLNQLKQKASLSEKLNDYRSLLIVRYALMEGPSLFAIIAGFITANYDFLYFSVAIILLFIIWAPAKNRLLHDLALSDKDIYTLESGNSES